MEKKVEWLREGTWQPHWSLDQLARETRPLWNVIKDDQDFLEPYIEMTRRWKEEQKGDLEHKYDAMGRCLADIAREAERRRKIVRIMEEDIKEIVEGVGVEQRKFYYVHFNYLARTDDDFFIPCEAAVVEFSLAEGVTRCWTELMSPMDSIPTGYKYRCIRHSRVRHNLTVEFEHYETDYRQIVETFSAFISGGYGKARSERNIARLPPVYSMPGLETEAAQCIMRFMLDKAGLPEASFSVYPLPQLLFTLCEERLPSPVVAQDLLEQDPFSHHTSLSCWLHESLGTSTTVPSLLPAGRSSLSSRLPCFLLTISRKWKATTFPSPATPTSLQTHGRNSLQVTRAL